MIVYGLCALLCLRAWQRILLQQDILAAFQIGTGLDLGMLGVFEGVVILALLYWVGNLKTTQIDY